MSGSFSPRRLPNHPLLVCDRCKPMLLILHMLQEHTRLASPHGVVRLQCYPAVINLYCSTLHAEARSDECLHPLQPDGDVTDEGEPQWQPVRRPPRTEIQVLPASLLEALSALTHSTEIAFCPKPVACLRLMHLCVLLVTCPQATRADSLITVVS